MIDHVGVRVRDLAGSTAFYSAVLAPLGYRVLMSFELGAGLGVPPKPDLWLYPGEPPPDDVHVALQADSRELVDACHEAAVAAGAHVEHAPRVWPEYHPGYYGVFLRDPDGYNLEVVHHTFAGQPS